MGSVCDGAFEAVLAGDTATHDAILSRALIEDMQGVDVVVLAQASMARVVKTMPAGSLTVPVLSSPELGVRQAREILAGLRRLRKRHGVLGFLRCLGDYVSGSAGDSGGRAGDSQRSASLARPVGLGA